MSRLKPINKSPKKVFNCMVYVIFCPKHRKIAVSDNFKERRELAIWLPFLYLSSDIKERLTVVESISLILSDGNPQLMAVYKKEQPFDSNVSYVRRAFLKDYYRTYTRSFCMVRLHSDNPVLQCCRKTSRILWIDIEKVLNDYIDCLWGPECLYYFWHFDRDFKRLRQEHHIDIGRYVHKLEENDRQVLKSLKINDKEIQLFYIDFTKHCFPSDAMSFISFKEYLRKYGFKTSEKSMKRLFNGFMKDTKFYSHFRHDLLFEELLLGLAHIDTQCFFNDSRLEFIFRYYDFDGDEYLSKEEFREMIEDIHKNETSDMIDSIVNDYWFIINPFEEGIDYDEFWDSVHNPSIILPDSLCQFENRILLKIISTLETRIKGIVSRIKTYVSHYCSEKLYEN